MQFNYLIIFIFYGLVLSENRLKCTVYIVFFPTYSLDRALNVWMFLKSYSNFKNAVFGYPKVACLQHFIAISIMYFTWTDL